MASQPMYIVHNTCFKQHPNRLLATGKTNPFGTPLYWSGVSFIQECTCAKHGPSARAALQLKVCPRIIFILALRAKWWVLNALCKAWNAEHKRASVLVSAVHNVSNSLIRKNFGQLTVSRAASARTSNVGHVQRPSPAPLLSDKPTPG